MAHQDIFHANRPSLFYKGRWLSGPFSSRGDGWVKKEMLKNYSSPNPFSDTTKKGNKNAY